MVDVGQVIIAQAVADDWELVGIEINSERCIVLVLLIIAIFVWCLVKPRVGRIVARIVAVCAFGAGVGALTWGICAAALGDPIRSIFLFPTLVNAPSDAIGLGAGLLAAGIMALVLSFIKGKEPSVDASDIVS